MILRVILHQISPRRYFINSEFRVHYTYVFEDIYLSSPVIPTVYLKNVSKIQVVLLVMTDGV